MLTNPTPSEHLNVRTSAQRAADELLAHPGDAPATVDGRVAAEVLGSNYWSLLDTVKRGTCPVPHLRVGRSIRFPTRPLLEAVGIRPAA